MLTNELIDNIEKLSTDPAISRLCKELRLFRAFYIARVELEHFLRVMHDCVYSKVPIEQQVRADNNTAQAMRSVAATIENIKIYSLEGKI